MNYGLSVKELLETNYLKDITNVLAGKGGISNYVRWVHVLEVRDIVDKCVSGNEIVLTTGIGFDSKEVALKFLQELIDQKVSALCIETALYYHKVDQELIDLAEKNDFPLIEIPEISRFLDITKGLNTLIINNEAKLYNDADNYNYQVSDINSKGTLADGIRYTAEYLDLDVAYLPEKDNTVIIAPELMKIINSKLEMLKTTLMNDEIYVKGKFAIKRINFSGKTWGHLVFNSRKRDLSDYEILILSRLSSKIKDDIFLKLLAKEEKLYNNNDWIKKWLQGNISEDDVKKKTRDLGIHINFSEFVVCCTTYEKNYDIDLGDKQENTKTKYFNEFLLHTSIIIRNIFESAGYYVLGYMENEYIYFIIMGQTNSEDIYTKIKQGIFDLRQQKNQFMDYSNMPFSIGKKVCKYDELKNSYNAAIKVIRKADSMDDKILIYDKLYISRIMMELEDKYVLDEFISDHIGELLTPSNLELLNTLRAYYECNCSKQKTAEKLFVVRQTLYFRLQKIAEILGTDFDDGEKRLTLEFAIKAYFYKYN